MAEPEPQPAAPAVTPASTSAGGTRMYRDVEQPTLTTIPSSDSARSNRPPPEDVPPEMQQFLHSWRSNRQPEKRASGVEIAPLVEAEAAAPLEEGPAVGREVVEAGGSWAPARTWWWTSTCKARLRRARHACAIYHRGG